MVSKSLDQLDAAAQAAQDRAAAAQDAADRARAQEQARRQERIDAHDQAIRDQYDGEKLQQDITDAEQQMTEAVRNDPLWQAGIRLGVAQLRLRDMWVGAGAVGHPPPPFSPIGFEQLARIADQAAASIAEDEADARAAARTAAADAAS